MRKYISEPFTNNKNQIYSTNIRLPTKLKQFQQFEDCHFKYSFGLQWVAFIRIQPKLYNKIVWGVKLM